MSGASSLAVVLRARNWCFTFMNPSGELEPATWFVQPSYLVYQLQCVPGTETLYYQGYVRFPSPLLLFEVKQLIGCSAHLEVARGRPVDNYTYCTRSDVRVPGDNSGPWEFVGIEHI